MPNDEDRLRTGEGPAEDAEDREEEPAAEEAEALREISEGELEAILAEHKKWLETQESVQNEINATKQLAGAEPLVHSPRQSVRNRGITRLNTLIQQYPDTQAAAKAKKLIDG